MSSNNLSGDTVRKEPVFICDVTGSMVEETAAPGSAMTKKELATDVARILVAGLAAADSQGTDEKGGGGLLTITFADGIATEVGDVNPANFETVWSAVRWGGGTYITPALDMATANFAEEFGHLPVTAQPDLILAILTDGALNDTNAANSFLRRAAGNVYVFVIVIGHGTAHDTALAGWQNIAETSQGHVQVEAANGSTDAQAIAARILAMVQ